MPELAEVEYYRKRWSPYQGETVLGVRMHSSKRIFRGVDSHLLCQSLFDQKLTGAFAHGKQLLFQFGKDVWLGIHLGMTGKLEVGTTDSPVAKHQHLCIDLHSGIRLLFFDSRMFGRVRFDLCDGEPQWWSELAPGLLSKDFTIERVLTFLRRRKGAQIKAVLLMQEMFPGIGNWMADEILWCCQIDPRTKAGKIDSEKGMELHRQIQLVARDAIAVIGSNWGDPPNSWLFNHRWKDGGNCPQTKEPLKRERIGGRTTCWSPNWQTYRGM